MLTLSSRFSLDLKHVLTVGRVARIYSYDRCVYTTVQQFEVNVLNFLKKNIVFYNEDNLKLIRNTV